MTTQRDLELLHQAARLAIRGHGGAEPNPMVGCVITNGDGAVVGSGYHQTCGEAHAEINAIRAACAVLGTHELRGCVLYTTCEPCPMCYGACCWARVDKIYFASNIHDAKEYGGFDDAAIYNAVKRPIQDRSPEGTELLRKEMLDLWQEFHNMADPPSY